MKKRPNSTKKPRRRTARETSRRRRSSAARPNTTIAVLTRERDELLEQQKATADLLGIISRSKFKLQPVLQTVSAGVNDGSVFHFVLPTAGMAD